MFCQAKISNPLFVHLLVFVVGLMPNAFSAPLILSNRPQTPPDSSIQPKVIYTDFIENQREKAKEKASIDLSTKPAKPEPNQKPSTTTKTQTTKADKISKNEAVNTPVQKYKRSSLYTLMVRDSTREHAIVIQNAFGDWVLSEKFNDHNIGPYVLEGDKYTKDQLANITAYLDSNQVAKRLVAKWFKRSPKGGFNMDLIAERGLYNATDLDTKQAKMNTRGTAILADAGEQLIGNTFVLVNDFKFVSKEEVASLATSGLRLLANMAAAAGNTELKDASNVAAVGATIAGKGYVIKTTSYLYKLNWNDSIAAIFYNDHWTDDANINQAKREAFESSNLFTLKYIGQEIAWADLQSSIFTSKSDAELIAIATTKATDAGIAKLQRKYEQFRTSTPLATESPITAQIGLKEGLEAGDKFEVLEQTLDASGKTGFTKVGVVKVSKNIWDNRYMADQDPKNEGKDKFTTFSKVSGGPFYPGMLIKQK